MTNEHTKQITEYLAKDESHFEQVGKFQFACGQPFDRTEIKPMPKKELDLRSNAMLEEYIEFQEASYNQKGLSFFFIKTLKFAKWMINLIPQKEIDQDIVGQVDALIDKEYFDLGTYYYMGITHDIYNKCFSAIQSSNMSKVGKDGKVVKDSNGKVVKGEGYRKPDLASILNVKGNK